MDLGYPNLARFASQHGLHRNTLHGFLRGKNVFSAPFQKIVAKLKVDPLDLIVPQSEFLPKLKYIEEIQPIVARLAKADPEMAVVLLGSRAGKRARPYSDWDLGIFRYPRGLSGMEYLRLKGMVQELAEDLVRNVDLVNLNQAPAWFLAGIQGEVVFLDGKKDAFLYLRGLLDGIQKEKTA